MRSFFMIGVVALSLAKSAAAADIQVTLVLKDRRFSPALIEAPADARIRIHLINRDSALEEFDSDDLGIERDVTPHGETTFTLGPLKAGTYHFVGELHSDTAFGVVHIKEAVPNSDEAAPALRGVQPPEATPRGSS